MNLFDAFKPERVEMERPFLTNPDSSLSQETRQYLYESRNGFKYIPQQGTHGGTLAKIARACGCSRYYVQMTLFPENPAHLFGNSDTQRAIWTTMAEMVRENPFYEPIKKAFSDLESKGVISLKIKANAMKFFLNRARELGYNIVVDHELPTSPRTYVVLNKDQ